MNKLFLLSFFLFLTGSTKPQNNDSLKFIYNNQTIYHYGGGMFLRGSERLTFRELRNEFSMSEAGLASYTKARQYKTTGKILGYLSMITGFATIAVIANSGNRNTAYIFLGGQFILGAGAAKYNQLSSQNLDRALWQRNKDLLFPNRQ